MGLQYRRQDTKGIEAEVRILFWPSNRIRDSVPHLMNILDNFKCPLFWFHIFVVRRHIENQPGSVKIRTGSGALELTEGVLTSKIWNKGILKISLYWDTKPHKIWTEVPLCIYYPHLSILCSSQKHRQWLQSVVWSSAEVDKLVSGCDGATLQWASSQSDSHSIFF